MRPAGRQRGVRTYVEVVKAWYVTPKMRRIVFGAVGGGPLETASEFTDAYVKMILPLPGSEIAEPFDLDEVKETYPPEQWPVKRTYSLREIKDGYVTIDFVIHGDAGVAGPWAKAAQVGQRTQFSGPGGAYRPQPDAPWHLLVGDESALPAIGAALEAIPADVPVVAFVEVPDADERQDLPHNVQWFYRPATGQVGEQLVQAVQDLEFLPGTPQVFAHGEAGFIRHLRRHLRNDRQIPRELLSISGYWRDGMDDEHWRKVKREWNAAVEAEDSAA